MCAKANYQIQTLDLQQAEKVAECVALLETSFIGKPRYQTSRLQQALQESSPPFYQLFFIATADKKIVGVGGVKSADWASHTHLLFLSAVEKNYRGQGIGRALIAARIDWIIKNHQRGRILVSTEKTKRFRSFGFHTVKNSGVDGKFLMMKKFDQK